MPVASPLPSFTPPISAVPANAVLPSAFSSMLTFPGSAAPAPLWLPAYIEPPATMFKLSTPLTEPEYNDFPAVSLSETK